MIALERIPTVDETVVTGDHHMPHNSSKPKYISEREPLTQRDLITDGHALSHRLHGPYAFSEREVDGVAEPVMARGRKFWFRNRTSGPQSPHLSNEGL